jgi:hypothetical protein
MPRFRMTLTLNACLAGMAFQMPVSSAVVARRDEHAPGKAVEAVMHTGRGRMFAANRQEAQHFLSPDASAPVVPRIMTLHDREVLRQQIQSTATGPLSLPPPAPGKSPK